MLFSVGLLLTILLLRGSSEEVTKEGGVTQAGNQAGNVQLPSDRTDQGVHPLEYKDTHLNVYMYMYVSKCISTPTRRDIARNQPK